MFSRRLRGNIRRNVLPPGNYGKTRLRLLRNAEVAERKRYSQAVNASAAGAATVVAATGVPVAS